MVQNNKKKTAPQSVSYSVEEESMSNRSLLSCYVKQAASVLIALSCLTLSGLAAADTVPKAVCGPGDHPETALQGQVPAALRTSGFQGFNCNLDLVGQSKGDGANWQSAEYRDALGNGNSNGKGSANQGGTVCAYHGTAFTTVGRTHVGVPVIDMTDNTNPTPTGYLATISMLDPWESLKVNERRKLLAADNGHNGGAGPEVDIYDLSGDCRFPQLLASVAVGTAAGGGDVAPITGHEGSWAPDGLTYYGGDLREFQYFAVDTTDPTRPTLITTFHDPFGPGPPYANAHGLSISDDGNRAYFVTAVYSSFVDFADLSNPNVIPNNGLIIADVSDIQARKPNPQVRVISKLLWKDGEAAQHTIPVKIGGKPYVIFVDEGGSGGNTPKGWNAACAAGLPAWPFARIIDISDETQPKIVSRLMLEVNDPANCSKVLPDLVGLSSFTYGSHYCSVDNKKQATTLACGYFNSGIRVFDIRDPTQPKEIAYYNPAGTTTPSPGSNHVSLGQWRAGGPDWCNAQVHLNAVNGTLWTTCQDNGLLSLKFTNGAWPFPQSKTPAGEQN
jgi:hypothetical protein